MCVSNKTFEPQNTASHLNPRAMKECMYEYTDEWRNKERNEWVNQIRDERISKRTKLKTSSTMQVTNYWSY